MLRVNIYQAKSRLSELLDLVARGEQVVLCKRNVPFAVLKALPKAKPKERPMGLAQGKMEIADSFFNPMSEDELALWEGSDSQDFFGEE